MREFRTSGSVGAPGGRLPGATRQPCSPRLGHDKLDETTMPWIHRHSMDSGN